MNMFMHAVSSHTDNKTMQGRAHNRKFNMQTWFIKFDNLGTGNR